MASPSDYENSAQQKVMIMTAVRPKVRPLILVHMHQVVRLVLQHASLYTRLNNHHLPMVQRLELPRT